MAIFLAAIEDIGKRNKLELLYNKYSLNIYRVAYSILNDRYLAQDAVQEAFIKVYNNLDKITEINCNKTKAFLIVIVRNTSINIYNQRRKRSGLSFEEIENELSESGPSLEEIIINNDTFTRVADLMKDLHPTYADILSLKYYYQYKDEEIANILNISPENTRVRLYRARKCLLALLSQKKEEAL